MESREHMRYLYTANDELFAYAPGRRDFFRVSDDSLWAHESHDWLVAATSGELLAHRTAGVYYGVLHGERLYYEAPERTARAEHPSNGSSWGGRIRAVRSAPVEHIES
jgi:hypothetical protein